jgi:hypothetical protein
MTIIYGVDTTKPLTPYDVRDAIVECFLLAHSEALEDLKQYGKELTPIEFENMKKIDVRQLVRNFFIEVGGDYEHPTKESIIKVVGKLKEFSVNFRNPEIVEKHASEIMELLGCLK